MNDGPENAIFFVVGSAGMLGRAWVELLNAQGESFTHGDLETLDLTKPESLDAIPNNTTHVINCAAYTNVDAAEEHEQLATEINGAGVANLAERCGHIDAAIVNYSTDYVFEGDATKPYPTDHPRNPLNAYGRGKAVGEQALEQCGIPWFNIRTSWLYAPWANNFVLTMARLTAEKPELKVVDDQRGRPTSATHLAHATLRLLGAADRGEANPGHWHITDASECTWHGLTTEIASLLGRDCRITPCTTDQFPRPARRPAFSVLDIGKTESAIGPMPRWQSNVAQALAQAGLPVLGTNRKTAP